MGRFVSSSGWALLAVAAMTAACADGARAGDGAPRAAGIPGIGPGTGVDVYIPNPDPQTPIAWSQGTSPPPPQGDFGGGVLQYLITGDEAPPPPHPPVPPPYFPQRVAPVRGPDGGVAISTNARPLGALVPPRRAAVGYRVGIGAPEAAVALAPAPAAAEPPPSRALPGGWGFGASTAFVRPRRPQARAAVPAPAVATIDPAFRRQEVAYAGEQPPGTVVVDTADKFLYLVERDGHALRYGIGVAKQAFLWRGVHTVTRKAEWPGWVPPAEMLGRRPDLPRHMAGGIENPLGARALYLGSTLYRIHGTNEPDTIGTNVSSGCIRLTNEDVTDLYGRVRVGTRVVVM